MKACTVIMLGSLMVALPTADSRAEDWRFALSPYAWFAGVEGEVATLPGSPVVPVDVSSSEALEDTEASFMVLFAAKKGRHGVSLDLLYTDTRSDVDLLPELGLSLRSTSKNSMYSAYYTYALDRYQRDYIDALVGLRYWDVESILNFRGGEGVLAGREISNAEDWLDPVLGLQGRSALGTSRFYGVGWAVLGGFGVGSDVFYDVSLNLGYQWSEAIGTTLGYRQFAVDYSDSGYVYDIEQAGWALGLTWQF